MKRRSVAEGGLGEGRDLQFGGGEGLGVDDADGIGVAVGDGKELLIGTEGELRRGEADGEFTNSKAFGIDNTDGASAGGTRDWVGDDGCAAGRSRGIAGVRPASAAVGDEDLATRGRHSDAEGSNANLHLPENFMCGCVNRRERIVAAEDDVDGLAVT